MSYEMDREAERRLDDYVSHIGLLLGNDQRRASFAMYACGLLGDGERKSVEPIAARACADPEKVDAVHQRLLHFLNDSPWSDRDVRRYAAKYGVDAITKNEPIIASVLDDTGFLKQGKHSVGVQRQYTGSAGKITNCQIAVSLSLVSEHEQLPVDFDLYLPRSWSDDNARRREARIPADVQFRTKPDIGLDLLRRAKEDGLPLGVVLADEAYGTSTQFRRGVRKLGLHYALAINRDTKVFPLDEKGKLADEALRADEYGLRLAYQKKAYQRTTWRNGTKGPLSARFAVRRVVPFHSDGTPPDQRERAWLVCEWRDGDVQPEHFYLAVVPHTMSKKRLIRLIKERWKTERAYEDLKGELGLDHFEGRRYPGWQHHVTVALACYAFIVAERARRFSPSEDIFLGDEFLDEWLVNEPFEDDRVDELLGDDTLHDPA